MIDIPLKYLCSRLEDKVIEVDLNASEEGIAETFQYKVGENYITRTEISLNTIIIQKMCIRDS